MIKKSSCLVVFDKSTIFTVIFNIPNTIKTNSL